MQDYYGWLQMKQGVVDRYLRYDVKIDAYDMK